MSEELVEEEPVPEARKAVSLGINDFTVDAVRRVDADFLRIPLKSVDDYSTLLSEFADDMKQLRGDKKDGGEFETELFVKFHVDLDYLREETIPAVKNLKRQMTVATKLGMRIGHLDVSALDIRRDEDEEYLSRLVNLGIENTSPKARLVVSLDNYPEENPLEQVGGNWSPKWGLHIDVGAGRDEVERELGAVADDRVVAVRVNKSQLQRRAKGDLHYDFIDDAIRRADVLHFDGWTTDHFESCASMVDDLQRYYEDHDGVKSK